jgi:hypothetical protein
MAFQTSTANSQTAIAAIPNGTSTTAQWQAYNNSDPTNAAFLGLAAVAATDARLTSGITGTGTYLPMTFYTGGSERVRVDTSGNVGIGTTGATGPLSVKTDTDFVIAMRTTPASTGARIVALNLAENAYKDLVVDGTTVQIATGGTERMRIDSSGNVGIGTSSPGDKLVVAASSGAVYAAFNNGTVNTVLGVSAGNVGLLGTTTNQDLLFYANNAERARITAAGLFQFNSGYGSVATTFGCRAWINFDGTSGSIGTGRGSGNVSSVTDNGTGDYTVNFTTAMPDGNYAAIGTSKEFDTTAFSTVFLIGARQTIANTFNTNYARVNTISVGGSLVDCVVVSVAIFR